MVKKARNAGMLHFLPPGPKFNPESQRLKDRILAAEMQAALTSKAAKATPSTETTNTATMTNVAGLTKVVAAPGRRQKKRRLVRAAPVGYGVFKKHLVGWDREVVWEGQVKVKGIKGEDIGNRLYAGKRRMFKGHKWERVREARLAMQKKKMRFMADRLKTYREVRVWFYHFFPILVVVYRIVSSLY